MRLTAEQRLKKPQHWFMNSRRQPTMLGIQFLSLLGWTKRMVVSTVFLMI